MVFVRPPSSFVQSPSPFVRPPTPCADVVLVSQGYSLALATFVQLVSQCFMFQHILVCRIHQEFTFPSSGSLRYACLEYRLSNLSCCPLPSHVFSELLYLVLSRNGIGRCFVLFHFLLSFKSYFNTLQLPLLSVIATFAISYRSSFSDNIREYPRLSAPLRLFPP